MKNRGRIFIVFIMIILIWYSKSFSLEEKTHEAINQHIAQSTINEFSLNSYLIDNLGLKDGFKESFKGIDASGNEVYKKVFEWLGYGGVQEDRPGEWYDYLPLIGKPTRSVNHFHNPLKAWSEAGLNDKILGILSYTGQSQVLWAQNSNQDVGGNWAWQDARRYFYISLTGRNLDGTEIARTKTERDAYFAYTFRAVGQLMHLVKDMSVPEHTRNDAHAQPAYEVYVEKTRTKNQTLWGSWVGNPTLFDKSILNIPTVTLAPVPISRIIDTDFYNSQNPETTVNSIIGMAEYTNANFLSRDTMFTDDLDPTHRHYFPFPKGSNAILWTDSSNNRRYLKKTGDGEAINHLAVASILYNDRLRYFPQYNRFLPVGLDDKCYEDYASKLIPRAVGYSAGLLDYFFRGEVEESYIEEQRDVAGKITGITMKIMNLTPDETMQGDVMVAYRYKAPSATEFTYGLSNIITGSALPYLGKGSYTFGFPSAIPSGASEIQYTFVFSGTLGKEEGAVIGKVVNANTTNTGGLINTSGRDSYGLSRAGWGGNVIIQADAVLQPVNATESLIVPAGNTVTLSGSYEYVTIQIDGTMQATGSLTLRALNGFYLNNGGLIRVEDGINGGTLTIESKGIVKLEGTIDTSGKNADSGGGGDGGAVTIKTSWPVSLQVPTIVTRGGDADEADIYRNPASSQGGRGGNVTITSTNADIIMWGGPPAVDTLPLPPPYNLGTYGRTRPDPGERIILRKAEYPVGAQIGFSRGILTSGGMGGSGLAECFVNQAGGQGGDGGNILISTQGGIITFRDVDLITGSDVETAISTIFLSDYAGAQNIYYAATGSLGGKGVAGGCQAGGNGGNGGLAGSIAVTGTIQPAPVRFFLVGGPYDGGGIIGFDDGQRRPYMTDDPFQDFIIGRTIQAEGADGSVLYRLRVDFGGNALGGSGGIPGGSATSFPGFFGYQGQGGTISGLRIQ